MGCRLSGHLADQRKEVKGRDATRKRREALHFLDEYGQPIAVQMEDRQGRRGGQRCYLSDCSTQTERHHWGALRRLGGAERAGDALARYAPGSYYDPMTLPPDLYAANGYLPSVSYGIDEMDSLDFRDSDLLSYQPNNHSCLIGCCNTDPEEPSSLRSQGEYESGWLEPPLGYLPLHERDSGLGCTDGSLHQEELSEPETEEEEEEEGPEDAVSSPPGGHTSRGSSPSSSSSSSSSSSLESLLSLELSDSGFHSISAGEFRRFQKILDARMHGLRARGRGSAAGSNKARRDLESIPEVRAAAAPADHAPSPASCRTEPCQRRALLRPDRHASADLPPGRCHTLQDLSDRRRRRSSHPTPAWPHPHSRDRCGKEGGGAEGDRGEYRWSGGGSGARPPAEPADWRGGVPPFVGGVSPPPPPPAPPRTPRTAARNQLLRARASRLADERSEVTTDEEVARGGGEGEGEGVAGWAGRYWSRTERRRHLALVRQQRQRKADGGGVPEVAGSGGSAGGRSVLELSQRKLDRLRSHKLLDDWTTVEELLTHGTRLGLADAALRPGTLLSVTTV